MSSHLQPTIGIDPVPPNSGLDPSSANPAGSESNPSKGKKRKNHRAGKKKKRRQSFGASTALDDTATEERRGMTQSVSELQASQNSGNPRTPFYRMGNGRNLSESSLESEALLDHRDHPPMRHRRDSRAAFAAGDTGSSYRPSVTRPYATHDGRRQHYRRTTVEDEEEQNGAEDLRTPLLGGRKSSGQGQGAPTGYGLFKSLSTGNRQRSSNRRESDGSSASSRHGP